MQFKVIIILNIFVISTLKYYLYIIFYYFNHVFFCNFIVTVLYYMLFQCT